MKFTCVYEKRIRGEEWKIRDFESEKGECRKIEGNAKNGAKYLICSRLFLRVEGVLTAVIVVKLRRLYKPPPFKLICGG